MKGIYIIIVLLFVFVQNATSQLVPSKFENVSFLLTFGKESTPAWGDDDHVQIHFFVIPKSETRPVYIRVFDPSTSGQFDTKNGEFNTRTIFTIYGGKGAYSQKEARSINPKRNYDKGRIIDRKVFYNEKEYCNKSTKYFKNL